MDVANKIEEDVKLIVKELGNKIIALPEFSVDPPACIAYAKVLRPFMKRYPIIDCYDYNTRTWNFNRATINPATDVMTIDEAKFHAKRLQYHVNRFLMKQNAKTDTKILSRVLSAIDQKKEIIDKSAIIELVYYLGEWTNAEQKTSLAVRNRALDDIIEGGADFCRRHICWSHELDIAKAVKEDNSEVLKGLYDITYQQYKLDVKEGITGYPYQKFTETFSDMMHTATEVGKRGSGSAWAST